METREQNLYRARKALNSAYLGLYPPIILIGFTSLIRLYSVSIISFILVLVFIFIIENYEKKYWKEVSR